MDILIVFLSLITSGLLVGNELAVAVFIHPILYLVPDDAHVRVAKPLAKRLGHYMPFWYAAGLVFAILQLSVTSRASNPSWWFCCAAAILLASIIVLTILLPVPINNKIAGWNVDQPPSDWRGMRQRWDMYHGVRVSLLAVALTLLILSALLR